MQLVLPFTPELIVQFLLLLLGQLGVAKLDHKSLREGLVHLGRNVLANERAPDAFVSEAAEIAQWLRLWFKVSQHPSMLEVRGWRATYIFVIQDPGHDSIGFTGSDLREG